MAEYSANAVQIVNPGESIVFTESPVPCTRGLVRHRDDSGSFLLSGMTPNRYGCNCNQNGAVNYLVDFGCNISIPEGGTVEEISVALALDGTTLQASTMRVTPAAVEEYFNISKAINVGIWANCCETVSVVNTSTQAIQVESANIIISRTNKTAGC